MLAFDFGTRRIGAAVGNTLTGSAQPLATLDAATEADRFAQVLALVGQWQPDRIVVGIPVHADGTPHAMTRRASTFARALAARAFAMVTGGDLLGNKPVLQRAVKMRSPYVDALSLLQLRALRALRDASPESEIPDAEQQRLLLLSVSGVAAGLQNTG